jgi:phenylacetate-CoA ligase
MSIFSFLRRNLIEPLWAVRSKSPIIEYWQVLEKSQFYREEQLLAFQWHRVKMLLNFAYNNNIYYRQVFDQVDLKPQDVNSYTDFRRLPVLTKKEIRQSGDLLISKGFEKGRLLEARTGGSTGKSVYLYYTEECSERRNASERRHDRWSGWEVGEPKGCVWGNPKTPTTVRDKLKWVLLSPLIFLDTMALTRDAVIGFAREWKRIKPTLLFGHAHSLFVLAQMLADHGIDGIEPRGIVSSSMMLLPHERVLIEEVFGRKVFDRYGCEEVGLIASECEEHRGLHLNGENLFVEFLTQDGQPASPGELGEIVVTDLGNMAMPFIRYRIEDMGIPSARKCPCGRGLPLMEEVTGRVADFLVTKDGSRIAGISLIENTLTKIAEIEQMQIVQYDLDRILLRIVADDDFRSEHRDALLGFFHQTFGDASVEVENVTEILRESNGKYRFSICHVPRG